MKLTITIELNEDEKGWITCHEMRSSFPTKNATRDVATLVAEAIELVEEARRAGLLAMVNDPTASP